MPDSNSQAESDDGDYSNPLGVFQRVSKQLLREGYPTQKLTDMLQGLCMERRVKELEEGVCEDAAEPALERILDELGGTSSLLRYVTDSKKICDALNVPDRHGYSEALIAKQTKQRADYAMNCSRLHDDLVRAKALLDEIVEKMAKATDAEHMGDENSRVVVDSLDDLAHELLVMQDGDVTHKTSVLRATLSYRTIDLIYDALNFMSESPDFRRADAYIVSITDNLCRAADWLGETRLVLCIEGILCDMRLVLHTVKIENDRVSQSRNRANALAHVLLMGARQNNTKLCVKALELKAPVDAQSHRSLLTALHWSAAHGNQELVNVLLAGKAQSLADARWEKPFMKAIYGGHVATAIRLLEKEPINPCAEVVDQFWAASNFVLEKMSRRNSDEPEYEALQNLLDALEPFGYGFNAERLGASIRLHMVPVVGTLARVHARDQMGCTVLMHLCMAASLSTDLLDAMLHAVIDVMDVNEINAADHTNKTAVDYSLSASNVRASIKLQSVNAVDTNGRTVFERAVLEDSAHLIQSLLVSVPHGESRRALKTIVERKNVAWQSETNNLWIVKQKDSRATFCTCFQPVATTQLQVRYPVVFGRVFPKVDALIRAPNVSTVLKNWRVQHDIKPPEVERPALEGYDGYDVWRGAITCWICKMAHEQRNKGESWVGPVVMQVKGDQTDADASCSLRLFMHHTCLQKLNIDLGGDPEPKRPSTSPVKSSSSSPIKSMPRRKKI